MSNYTECDVWEYFQPNPEEMYTINIFDDGNNQYEVYENKWLLFGKWRGKYALVNIANPNIKIHSISQWKLSKSI
jgi:hypothetical protein